ncbi:hypothetical protein [Clostridium sp. JS66]|uniref:hypothetical protein n=1 Tax=Clostridium sp. JS66 TaxID=3064705 RepID=UPI00298EA085|nr:hypothetical protein [Clostridium sp. JS66]WPC42485.1 hypothetical protein Q6H37_03190 [Clostridium sp. JS66]
MEKFKDNLTEEEFKIEAVEFYNKYKKYEEIFKLIQSKGFIDTLSKLYNLINKNTNKILVKTYKNIEDKKRIIMEKYPMNQYKFIALNEKSEIIEIYDCNKVAAYALISYESEIDFGQYAFLHFINFINGENSKNYKKFEKLIIEKIKNKSILYFDRTISFQSDDNKDERALEEIKNMGYMCVWKNCTVELNIENFDKLQLEVNMKKVKNIDMDYTAIGKIIPSRFENRSNIYEGILQKEKFFINIVNKQDKAFVNFYIYNGKIDDKDYIIEVYKITFKFLSEHNINKLVTFMSPENIILLNNTININILQNIYWLRKQL